MKFRWLLIILMCFGLAACSFGGKSSNSDRGDRDDNSSKEYEEFQLDLASGAAELGRLNMSLSKLGPFYSVFTLQFDGSEDWVYQVETRFDGNSIEYNLNISGVTLASDPGDVRLVNTDGINQMIGQGTDNLCVQFPDEMNTGVLFLSPVDVVNPDVLTQDWKFDKNETFLDRPVAIQTTDQEYYYGWEKIRAELIVDDKTGAILQYTFNAEGSDPLYGNGSGTIHGEFVVQEIAPQTILNISGCKFPFPVPEDAHNIVILPGLYSFETSLGPVKMDEFFDQQLLIAGWGRQSALVNDGVREAFLEYFNESQTLTVHIEAINTDDFTEGYTVKLFLEDR